MPNRKRLKILFLTTWYPSEINPVNGIGVREQAKAALLYNDIVVLHAYFNPFLEPQGLHGVSEDIEDGIRTIRVEHGRILSYLQRKPIRKRQSAPSDLSSKPFPSLGKPLSILGGVISDLLCYWTVFVTFRKLIKDGYKPDIIHAHVFTAGVPAVILGKLYRIPVIITERYSDIGMHSLTCSERVKARFALKRAQVILPLSNDLRTHIEAYGIKNQFKTIPNPVNIEMFHPCSQNNKQRDETKSLLLVAALRPVKGVSYLLQALSQLKGKRKDFCLDIVGYGPSKDEYEELTQKLGLGGMVKFHGLKLPEEVAQFMRECDFYVLPSLWENLPSVLIEAMSCGKPVIATEVGGVKEIINEKVGILVPPGDVEALREAIEYMLDNYQNYSPEEIAQYVRERFSYEVVGKMLDEVYQKVALSNSQYIK